MATEFWWVVRKTLKVINATDLLLYPEDVDDVWLDGGIPQVVQSLSSKLARSFTSLQKEVRMPSTPELRPFARRLNRLWSNVVLTRLDEDEAGALIQELYETRPTSDAAESDPS